MSVSDERKAAPPLQALQSSLTAETLARLQPILLLQILIGFSQSLNGGVAQSETLARTLLLDGRQRLQKMLASAPRLNLPLERVLEIIHATDEDDQANTAEENAIQALVEMCLGLMLQWLSQEDHRSYAPTLLTRREAELPSDNPPFSRLHSYPAGKRVGSPPIHAALTVWAQ